MICKNDLGSWGVQAEGLDFSIFVTLCQVCGYLNKLSPEKPDKEAILGLPDGCLGEVEDIVLGWYKKD